MIVTGLLAAFLASGALAAPSSSYVIHQRRSASMASKWVERAVALDKSATIPMSIGLKQQNLDKGDEYLMDVSDPDSANFGKHWTPAKVAATFGASDESVAAVKSWLASSGIAENRASLSQGRNWLNVQLSISEAEKLLQTQYKVYEHAKTAKNSLAVEDYSVPASIQKHIDFITPTIATTPMARVKPAGTHPNEKAKARHDKNVKLVAQRKVLSPSSIQARDSGVNRLTWDESNCGVGLTRACAQSLYNIPNNTLTSSSFAVVEYQNEMYSQADSAIYMYNLVSTTHYNITPAIYIMSDTTFPNGSNTDKGEGNLDVQIAQGLTYPQPLSYYQIGQDDVFLDAVDASYCNVSAPTSGSNSSACGTTPLTSVISVSWGQDELYDSDSLSYQNRMCTEYMKLGLMGTSMIYSSGDNGVAGNGETCTQFIPSFPSTCPYVTSVGATKIPVNGTVKSREIAVDWFASGGGFSNIYTRPSWQSDAVSGYLKNNLGSTSKKVFNATGNTRAYPDISANGNGYQVIMDGNWTQTGGTSASAPIIGSIISLINEQRLKAGKTTVGFLNPVLYKNPKAMNDVVEGNNPGCNSNGFPVSEGWDPVTGLGTVDYKRLLDVYLALP